MYKFPKHSLKYKLDDEYMTPYYALNGLFEYVNIDKKTRIEMKKQKVPRKILSSGLKIPIYRKYGAKDFNVKDLEEERSVTSDYVKNLMKNDISFNRLIKISEKYNQWRKEYVKRLSF